MPETRSSASYRLCQEQTTTSSCWALESPGLTAGAADWRRQACACTWWKRATVWAAEFSVVLLADEVGELGADLFTGSRYSFSGNLIGLKRVWKPMNSAERIFAGSMTCCSHAADAFDRDFGWLESTSRIGIAKDCSFADYLDIDARALGESKTSDRIMSKASMQPIIV